ncbi:MAG: hypothetical protein A2Y45_09420 [Tenericutes bacterium GWC2_34_14]|jgi:hypothetical protein|nr:MAG: hypothetical protein A2Y45_09420 [Tenericutes bacterium GWC2_34_14]OHE34146.1 MAG: hypothetical protein A2012_04725 [Tenericutes bacterium GWE2_34_108]OHE35477.1 MAG: hypothetical protein A2Y46_05090 [Tenericutes bacterium GWF1_35_14]OHE38604.1 MAG: hypothetical protein A2Y44_04380 [Tenericutes bacterium GWF2_35_184]OHE43782.1 MAG: hypothetical protein A2221_00495 [Tenericutes bacterium RIFOXYA2_FULL_36_32]OHE45801.1 MAG: hypothetical protein A2308_08315 [Tenericutes bacterium RIFOXYB2
MEKTINLRGEDLKLRSSLFTIISYRNVFGTELFSDIKKLENLNKDETDAALVIDILFRIIYILHKPYTKKSYDEFLMDLDFSVLSDVKELENISNTITLMLGGNEGTQDPK